MKNANNGIGNIPRSLLAIALALPTSLARFLYIVLFFYFKIALSAVPEPLTSSERSTFLP